MEQERALKFTARINQLVEEGQMVELEFRDKTDSRQVGKVLFVGDDYIEFTREVKSEAVQEGSDEKSITIFNLTTIVLLSDIQAFTILKEASRIKSNE